MSVVYEEFVDFIAGGTTPKEVVDFQPSPDAKLRVQELMSKHKQGEITPDESEELSYFMHVEHLMRLAKARARQRMGEGA